MIYSVGLTDYLNDEYVVDLINWAYNNLLPGGTIVIGNVVPSNPNKAYMDHILEWVLIHRTAEELRNLFKRSSDRVSVQSSLMTCFWTRKSNWFLTSLYE